MNENLKNMLNSLKGKTANLWHDGAFTTSVVSLNGFEWWGESKKDGTQKIVFSSEGDEETYKLDLEVLLDAKVNEDINEILFMMENGELIQLWSNEII